MSIKGFLQIDKSFIACRQTTNILTGECITWSATQKIVYSVMKDRYKFFTSINSTYHDSQEQLAGLCGIDKRSLQRILKQLAQCGIITSTPIRLKGYLKGTEYVVDDISDKTKYKSDIVLKTKETTIDSKPEIPS